MTDALIDRQGRALNCDTAANEWADAYALKAQIARNEAERNAPRISTLDKAIAALCDRVVTIKLTPVEIGLLMGLGFLAGPPLFWVAG